MRYFYGAAALLLAVLALCVICVCSLSRMTGKTLDTMQDARAAAAREDYPAAREAARNAADSWAQLEGLLDVLLDHRETDEIHFAFAALLACAEDPDSGELLYRCDELIAQLHHISELEMPYYFNIL